MHCVLRVNAARRTALKSRRMRLEPRLGAAGGFDPNPIPKTA
jgi:hypothetical protein